MKRHFTAIQKACGWPAICRQTAEQYGSAEADALMQKAEALYEKHSGICGKCRGTAKMHVLSAAAFGSIYLPLKELTGSEQAVRMMEDAAKPASLAKNKRIGKLPAGLFMKVAGVITSKMFSEKAGFQRKQHADSNAEKRYDLLTCPYLEVLTNMGCPEACPAICIQDDYSFSNLKNGVIFERKKTLGRGGDCCDFCFRLPGSKAEAPHKE